MLAFFRFKTTYKQKNKRMFWSIQFIFERIWKKEIWKNIFH